MKEETTVIDKSIAVISRAERSLDYWEKEYISSDDWFEKKLIQSKIETLKTILGHDTKTS